MTQKVGSTQKTAQNVKTIDEELKKMKMKWLESDDGGKRQKSVKKTGLCVIPIITIVFTFIYVIIAIICYNAND